MFSRGFLGSVPPVLIKTVIESTDVASWNEVYVACSGTFRTERLVLGAAPSAVIRSNDVSLFSCGIGRWLTDAPHDFKFVNRLAFVEELGLKDPLERLGAIIVVMNMAGYATGKENAFKREHMAHFEARFRDYVDQQVKKLAPVKATTPIASFHARDWVEHVDEAIARGAGVLAYPPTFKGGYEKLFAFINDNVEWEPPPYNLWDPARIGEIIDRLDAGGVPYFIYADQKIDGREPTIEFNQNGKRTVYGYAKAKRAAYLARGIGPGQPFAYEPLDPAKLDKKTNVEIVPAPGNRLTFLKNVYLKKTIQHCAGQINFLVYLDGMLAGGLIYSRSQYSRDSLFLLSDFATTRNGRIAKLIARLATSKDVISFIEKRFVGKFDSIATAVFSDNPASMKYRGVFELHKREERNAPEGRYMLYYVSKVRNESIQEAYRWWADRNLEAGVGQAANRNPPRQPEIAPPA